MANKRTLILARLRRLVTMLLLSSLKRRRLIDGMGMPYGVNNPDPDIGECSECHTMTFALCPFALIVGFGPRLLHRRLPGELIQGITQRFDAGRSPVYFRIGAT